MASILITGAGGFLGQFLATALLEDPSVRLTLTDIVPPPTQDARVTSLGLDLTSPETVRELLSERFSAVYILHGLMSSGSETNLSLGLSINFDSIRSILDTLREKHPETKVIFSSACAVYSHDGSDKPVSEFGTVPRPKSSYGAEKLMVEMLLNDYSRRGLIDGRIVRIPTVIVRPGAPSAAASSFASGIVRESLRGTRNVLPVGRDVPLWVCSPRTVVANLIKVKEIPAASFGESRIVNLPGITVTVQDILDAVKEVGGQNALDMVEEKRDEEVERIVCSWPAKFDISRALSLGLQPDGTVLDAVRAFLI